MDVVFVCHGEPEDGHDGLTEPIGKEKSDKQKQPSAKEEAYEPVPQF